MLLWLQSRVQRLHLISITASILLVAFGVAHHLTFVLLLPAALYYIWVKRGGGLNHLLQAVGVLTVGGLLGVLF